MKNARGSLIRPLPLPGGASHPVVTPLSPSVVYASETPDALDAHYDGQSFGYTYAREGHPNADVISAAIDAMEGGKGGLITGSGMAAVSAVLMGLCRSGDHVVGGNQLYGRSLRMLSEDLPRFGVDVSLVDTSDAEAFGAAITPATKLALIEVVSNPTLRVADLEGISRICQEKGVLLAVDNTFTTPRAIRPFDLGADIVLHSITKLLAGHSDVTLGYAAARDPQIADALRVFAVTAGLTPSPFDCWLAERGLLTFPLRFDRAEQTARALADHLSGLRGVRRVLYPLRTDHPDHDRAKTLLGPHGSNMVSFELDGGRAVANAFARAADGLQFAPTLGDVGTTLSHPASSSHRGMTPEQRKHAGITEGFFRVSVGLEDETALLNIFATAVAEALP